MLRPLWQASRARGIGHAHSHRRTGLARKDAQASLGPSIVPDSDEVDGWPVCPRASGVVRSE